MKKKILIIDDALDICEILTGHLQSLNFDCTWNFSAVEALATLADTKPDLIVLDMDLPLMSGFGFLSEIKEHPDFIHTPVVILSGVRDKLVKKEALSSGARAYVTKPCSFGDILAAIRSNLPENYD